MHQGGNMSVWTDLPHDAVTRQRRPWGVRALAVLLLLGLLPQAFAAPTRLNFDHLTTGFELIGQHRDLPCEACHANAMFQGTPRDCAACHGVGTAVRATAKPANHILSTDQCASCHTPIAWNPAVNFDHTQVRGSCSTCHNGVQAQGKGPTHIVTDLECDACHTTLSWGGAVFSHVGVTNNCASCHNGVSATGMPPTHIPVGTPPTPCEGCHSSTNFTTWAGTLINHLAVTALTCASCHETAAFLGMHPSTNTAAGDSRPPAALDPSHPPKSAGDCGVCHGTTSFGSSALRPANHIPTSAPCVQCHTTAGNYTVKATFTEPRFMELNSHPHSYGIFIGGNAMGTEQMSLVYCVAYGSGEMLVRGFSGPAVFTLARQSANAAVHKAAGVGKPVTQEIAWRVKGGRAECSINGAMVAAYDRAELVTAGKLRSTDGVFGLRFTHNVEAVITSFGMTKN